MVHNEHRNKARLHVVANTFPHNSVLDLIQALTIINTEVKCSGEYLNDLKFADDVSLLSEVIQDL